MEELRSQKHIRCKGRFGHRKCGTNQDLKGTVDGQNVGHLA